MSELLVKEVENLSLQLLMEEKYNIEILFIGKA